MKPCPCTWWLPQKNFSNIDFSESKFVRSPRGWMTPGPTKFQCAFPTSIISSRNWNGKLRLAGSAHFRSTIMRIQSLWHWVLAFTPLPIHGRGVGPRGRRKWGSCNLTTRSHLSTTCKSEGPTMTEVPDKIIGSLSPWSANWPNNGRIGCAVGIPSVLTHLSSIRLHSDGHVSVTHRSPSASLRIPE